MNQNQNIIDKFTQFEDKARKEYGYRPRPSFVPPEKKTVPATINAAGVPPLQNYLDKFIVYTTNSSILLCFIMTICSKYITQK